LRCGAGASGSGTLHSAFTPWMLISLRPRQRRPRKNPFSPDEKTMWPDRRLIDLFNTEFPIILAPMAGAMDADLVIAAAQSGALGSLPCALLSVEKAREQVNIIRQRGSAPVNMNFFCHKPVNADPKREAQWKQRLAPYYKELGLDPGEPISAANRAPFDAAMCELVEKLKPEIVSFHFGLPDKALLKRVKTAGCVVISSATSRRRSGSRRTASMPSSRRAPRPAAIAACS
jgi:nitronate monooxygenase